MATSKQTYTHAHAQYSPTSVGHPITLAHCLYVRTPHMGTYIYSYGEWRKYSEKVIGKLQWTYLRGVLGSNTLLSHNPHMYLPLPPSHIHTMVMCSLVVTYFNVLKFLITLGSASAVAPSSPIPLHSESRLDKNYIRMINKTRMYLVHNNYYITPFHRNLQQFRM